MLFLLPSSPGRPHLAGFEVAAVRIFDQYKTRGADNAGENPAGKLGHVENL